MGWFAVLLLGCSLPCVGLADELSAEKTKLHDLTLRHLFHPDKKVDFDGKLPKTHWIGRQQSQLLIRKDDRWWQFDLQSQSEGDSRLKAWPVFDQLCKQLATLPELGPDQAEPIIADAIESMVEPADSLIVRSGDGVIAVSAQMPARYLSRDGSTWRDPTMDPTGRKVAYTRDGDLFVLDVATNLTRRLTNDASDTLLDGILDWTYQEEIFGRGNYRAFWFSPDGQWLAMMRIDVSQVKPYVLGDSASARNAGPAVRYSKAGDPIPHASLVMWDLRDFAGEGVPPARVLAESTAQDEIIITGVWWHQHQKQLVYCVSDRKQTYRELRMIPAGFRDITDAKVLLREESPAWVEPPASPAWLSDGDIVWRSELPSGHHRLYRIDASGHSMYPVTPEDVHVLEFSVSQPNGSPHILFTADHQGSRGKYVFRMTLPIENRGDVASVVDSPDWMTQQPGWHHASFSPDGRWFTDRHSTAATPPSLSVRSIEPRSPISIEIAREELRTKTPISAPEIFTIAGDDNVTLPAMLIRPRITEAAKDMAQYPVVVEVYGGPGTPSVRDRWRGTSTLYRELLSRQGIATLIVDNRSSSGDSVAASWPVQRQLGKLEFADLMTSVAWLKKQPWVDTDAIAIRGWSYGGFMTLYAMTHSNAFAAGVAGGSVTDWAEYDSFYTERYMGLPSENPKGYQASSIIAVADQLSGKLLLVHGEVDDNVHPACSLRMAGALQRAGKDFELMIYPGAGHALTDGHQKWHLANLSHEFLIETFESKSGKN